MTITIFRETQDNAVTATRFSFGIVQTSVTDTTCIGQRLFPLLPLLRTTTHYNQQNRFTTKNGKYFEVILFKPNGIEIEEKYKKSTFERYRK